MLFHEDIDAIKSRIAGAGVRRDASLAAGLQENYLAAYFAIEALEFELGQRLLLEGTPARPAFADTEAMWKSP